MNGQPTKKGRGGVSNVLIWIVIGALILCSLYVSKTLFDAYFHSNQSADWPSVSGVVLEKHVKQLKSSSNSRSYISSISYQFAVDGKEYVSERMSVYSLTESYRTREQALELHNRLPQVGRAIDVFYKPGDPAFAVVYIQKKPMWKLLSIAAFMWAFSLAFAYQQWRKQSKVTS